MKLIDQIKRLIRLNYSTKDIAALCGVSERLVNQVKDAFGKTWN